MTENLTIYEKAVTTERNAELIARMHGFESVAQLAESLPQGARVLDAGAGASPFGKEVAALRPDITWTNYDYSYNDPAILDDVSRDAPDNVQYVPGDATRLGSDYESETFDAVFSYWLVPHLSLDGPGPATAAAKGLFVVTKPKGYISIGPKTSKRGLPSIRAKEAYHAIKDEGLDLDSFAETVIEATTLHGISHHTQKFANEVVTPYLGTSRYTKNVGRVPYIYHRESRQYVSPFSRKGLRITGGLVVAASRHEQVAAPVIRKVAVAVGGLALATGAAHHVAKKRKNTR